MRLDRCGGLGIQYTLRKWLEMRMQVNYRGYRNSEVLFLKKAVYCN